MMYGNEHAKKSSHIDIQTPPLNIFSFVLKLILF